MQHKMKTKKRENTMEQILANPSSFPLKKKKRSKRKKIPLFFSPNEIKYF